MASTAAFYRSSILAAQFKNRNLYYRGAVAAAAKDVTPVSVEDEDERILAEGGAALWAHLPCGDRRGRARFNMMGLIRLRLALTIMPLMNASSFSVRAVDERCPDRVRLPDLIQIDLRSCRIHTEYGAAVAIEEG
jgi:hypothetical protein